MGTKIDRIELFHVAIPPARLTTDDGVQGLAAGVAFERERQGLGSLLSPT